MAESRWFVRKRFGIGWRPASPAGWATLAAFMLARPVGAWFLRSSSRRKAWSAAWTAACTIALLSVVVEERSALLKRESGRDARYRSSGATSRLASIGMVPSRARYAW